MRLALNASQAGFGTALCNATPLASGSWTGLETVGSKAVFAPLALAAVLGVMFLVARAFSRLGAASRRAAIPWLCGYAQEAECHHYVAHQFYGEIKRYFRWLGGAPHPRPEKPDALKEH
jgi:hypothetical protein